MLLAPAKLLETVRRGVGWGWGRLLVVYCIRSDVSHIYAHTFCMNAAP